MIKCRCRLVGVAQKVFREETKSLIDFADLELFCELKVSLEPAEIIREIYPCAVQRRCLSAGAKPVRQLSLQPVAIGAVVEATKRLKPPV